MDAAHFCPSTIPGGYDEPCDLTEADVEIPTVAKGPRVKGKRSITPEIELTMESEFPCYLEAEEDLEEEI